MLGSAGLAPRPTVGPVADRGLVVVTQRALGRQERDALDRAAGGGPVVVIPRALELRGEHASLLARAEVVAGGLPPGFSDLAGILRWNHVWGAGADDVLTEEMRLSPVRLTGSSGNGAVPLAEHAVMLVLMVSREAQRWLRAQGHHRWERFVHPELAGSTVGILGWGPVGREVAARLRPFNTRIFVLRRTGATAEGADGVFPAERLHDFLRHCDHLVVTAPLTPATRGMLGASEFATLPPGATYVNVSRGAIADQQALLAALRSGRLGGAGLDAHSEEPLDPLSPFWSLPSVVVTPHNGATTPQTAARGWEIFLDNLTRYRSGAPLVNQIDKVTGYTSTGPWKDRKHDV